MVLRIALHGNDTKERIGALKVMLAFCIANREGQQALVSTMPLPGTNASQQPGLQCLLCVHDALLTPCPLACTFWSWIVV